MSRWWLIPRNRWMNIYLHQFHRSDDGRALHDHPWWSVSVMLRGWMMEVTQHPTDIRKRLWTRISAGGVRFRSGNMAHRLAVHDSQRGRVLTLFITGPKFRDWGFYCPQGWRPWQKFVDPKNPGLPGPGCD
jgi:hypothetical protein